jgi:hypothetical protein
MECRSEPVLRLGTQGWTPYDTGGTRLQFSSLRAVQLAVPSQFLYYSVYRSRWGGLQRLLGVVYLSTIVPLALSQFCAEHQLIFNAYVPRPCLYHPGSGLRERHGAAGRMDGPLPRMGLASRGCSSLLAPHSWQLRPMTVEDIPNGPEGSI